MKVGEQEKREEEQDDAEGNSESSRVALLNREEGRGAEWRCKRHWQRMQTSGRPPAARRSVPEKQDGAEKCEGREA